MQNKGVENVKRLISVAIAMLVTCVVGLFGSTMVDTKLMLDYTEDTTVHTWDVDTSDGYTSLTISGDSTYLNIGRTYEIVYCYTVIVDSITTTTHDTITVATDTLVVSFQVKRVIDHYNYVADWTTVIADTAIDTAGVGTMVFSADDYAIGEHTRLYWEYWDAKSNDRTDSCKTTITVGGRGTVKE